MERVRLSPFGWLTVAWLVLAISLLSLAGALAARTSLRLIAALFLFLFALSLAARTSHRREMRRRDREALKRSAAQVEAVL